jgi:hypothetical protein
VTIAEDFRKKKAWRKKFLKEEDFGGKKVLGEKRP